MEIDDNGIIDISRMGILRQNDCQFVKGFAAERLKFVNVSEDIMSHLKVGDSKQYLYSEMMKHLNDSIKFGLKDFSNEALGVVDNLNSLSFIETRLKLRPVIFAPGQNSITQSGWIAGFKSQRSLFTSPEMETEALARAFNIVLFLKLNIEL
jgi:hypothetical protein